MRILLLGLALTAGAAFAQNTPSQSAPAQTAPAAPVTTPAQPAPAQDPSTVVGRVGGEDITLGEFESKFNVYVGRLVNSQGMPFSAEVLPYFNEYRPEILKQVVRQRGLLQLARNAGVQVEDTRVDEIIASNRQDFRDDAEFNTALQQAGYVDETQLRNFVRDSLTVSQYLDTLKGRFKFNDAVVNGYYQGHLNDFRQPAQACVKHILVRDEATATTVKQRLSAGEDFAKVAQEVSMDPGSKGDGGDLGCFEKGVTVPEFDRASFSGPVGELQQVKTQFGVHLLVVSKRNAAGLQPLADVQDKIRQTLASDAAQRYVDSLLARMSLMTFPEKVTLAAPAQK